ncbi:MAG: thioredoxin family protein [Oligoflexus sp.]
MLKSALILASLLAVPAASYAKPTNNQKDTTKAVINQKAPDFSLPGHDGKTYKLSDFEGKTVVLEWWNKDCPFVVKHYSSGNMQGLQTQYTDKGVVWFTMLSSAPGKQGHLKPDEIKKVMDEQKGQQTAVLIDEKGEVGRDYGAQTTPHMYVINKEGKLVYMGAIDNRPTPHQKDLKGATNYVKGALEATLAQKDVELATTKAYGCNVKY